MKKKLTLRIDESVIELAKIYACNRKTSLSNLVENYLRDLTNQKDRNSKMSPLVKSISGVLDLPNDYDHERNYRKFLREKYSGS